MTDEGGRFVFAIVRPDTYTLQVALQGFKTLERTNVVERQRQNHDWHAHAGSRPDDGRGQRHEPRDRGPVDERGALVRAGERGPHEHRRLVAAALQLDVARAGRGPERHWGTEIGAADGFTVNGQRPNSNNVTIDGVANIDTGDNGGNMVTTNLDSVAEFRVLTNAYQAEYGRAVGGQLQVVTKSGTQAFHGSGYWYGRRSDWNANTWINKRVTPEIPQAETSRNDSGYTIGGPIFMPGFNEDKKRLFFF